MITKPRLGHIYIALAVFPEGTRVEFIGGPDDDIFSDGNTWTWLDNSELMPCDDQSYISYTPLMGMQKSTALAGITPDMAMNE